MSPTMGGNPISPARLHVRFMVCTCSCAGEIKQEGTHSDHFTARFRGQANPTPARLLREAGSARPRTTRTVLAERAVIIFRWVGCSVISLGGQAPHVPRTHAEVNHTCRGPSIIEAAAAHRFFYRPLLQASPVCTTSAGRRQMRSRGQPPSYASRSV